MYLVADWQVEFTIQQLTACRLLLTHCICPSHVHFVAAFLLLACVFVCLLPCLFACLLICSASLFACIFIPLHRQFLGKEVQSKFSTNAISVGCALVWYAPHPLLSIARCKFQDVRQGFLFKKYYKLEVKGPSGPRLLGCGPSGRLDNNLQNPSGAQAVWPTPVYALPRSKVVDPLHTRMR